MGKKRVPWVLTGVAIASFLSLLLILLAILVVVIGTERVASEVRPGVSENKKSGGGYGDGFKSALGDPGMTDPRARIALEAWNFCNKVGNEEQGPSLPSPRHADCTDLDCVSTPGECSAIQHVKTQDNELKYGDSFPQGSSSSSASDPDDYAVQKELYLGSLCEVKDIPSKPWQFWMIMLKNGNFDTSSGLCPSTASTATTFSKPFSIRASLVSRKLQNARIALPNIKSSFPCFGRGCMNQPIIYHDWSSPKSASCTGSSSSGSNEEVYSDLTLMGRFYGTYDTYSVVDKEGLQSESNGNLSYFSVRWEKNIDTGSWMFHHILKVTKRYPWLMLYLRADATKGLSGGYPWETRGMITKVPESPNFKVVLTLNITKGGGSQSQFYLLDIGGCWKNNGEQCDGDVKTDVTRYSEMIINPLTDSWCRATDLSQCPPYHVTANGTVIYRNETTRFPYAAYHLYCAPPNAKYAEKPFHVCDLYSNPQAQEIMQLLPHPEWAIHGYPSQKGQGWVGDARKWELDVGALSSRLYFYQDPGTKPARRFWPSLDVGTEIYMSSTYELAEWTVSDFDVIIPADSTK